MLLSDWYEHLRKEGFIRKNRVYGIIYSFLQTGELYLEQIEIFPQYRGRGYLKRILDNLCKEYHTSIVLECVPELAEIYSHIGCFTTLPYERWRYSDLIEFYYDPLGIHY